MQSVTLQGTVRTDLGTKYAKQLREQGHVPCVMYGGEQPVHFYAPTLAFRDLVYTAEARMASIELNGKTYQAVIQDMQFHVLNDALTHVDFIQVLDGKPVTIQVPMILTGNARGVRSGGKMKFSLRNLKVKGLINDLPSSIEHDITELRIGQAIRVSDIKAGKRNVTAPLYSHLTYDVLKDERAVIDQPDILIVEGVNVLQTGRPPRDGRGIPNSSDFFDFSVYIDADTADLKTWYIERFLTLRDSAFRNPKSYFHRYATLSDKEAQETATRIWDTINLVNLRENILPTRPRADLVLRKGADHFIRSVFLRKL